MDDFFKVQQPFTLHPHHLPSSFTLTLTASKEMFGQDGGFGSFEETSPNPNPKPLL